jgi:hypothetical protein
MTTILSYFIIFTLGIWLFFTIVAQFRGIKWVEWVLAKDYFALIPSWTFFAPNPGVTDYQIFYRDKLLDGQYNNWKQVKYRNNSLLHSILNPDKRRRKAIAECCISILNAASKNKKENAILSSFPYLVILTYIMSMPKNSLCEYRQFLIACTFGYTLSKEPKILFISHLHNISSDK